MFTLYPIPKGGVVMSGGCRCDCAYCDQGSHCGKNDDGCYFFDEEEDEDDDN